MLQLAIFSDVHGNLPALHSVLEDLKQRGVEQAYCLGDLVDFAPWSNEVINCIRYLQIPCLMGNHDERIAFDYEISPLSKHSAKEIASRIKAINYTKQTLTAENKAFLRTLPLKMSMTFKVAGREIKLLLVHGSSSSNEEYIYETHPEDDIHNIMTTESADILIMGHTHLPYIRYIQQKMAINCGSVGRSKEASGLATYLLLNVTDSTVIPEIVRLAYPIQETIVAIQKSYIPDFYADFLNKSNLFLGQADK